MAIGISLTDITSLQNETTALTALNDNFDAIAAALPDGLSRSGNTPNTMGSALDMNSNQILNLPAPIGTNSPLRVADATTLNGGGIITVSPLPTGGTTGQVLAKTDNGNYDVSWVSPSAINTTNSSSLTLTGSTLGTVALTGDVNTNSNSFSTMIATNAVTNAKFRQSAPLSVVGNVNNSPANVSDIPGVANQVLSINSSGTALGFTSITGDVSNSNGNITVNAGAINGTKIGTNTVLNANLSQANAVTLKGNPTASSANVTDFTIQGLTRKSSPVSGDAVLVWDHVSGTFQYSYPTDIAGSNTSGVTSIDTQTGTFTTGNGIISSGAEIQLSAARRTLPTRQTFTSGSVATYTTPTNALWLRVRIVGAGGGGGASNASTNGITGGTTTFGSTTALGGSPGTGNSSTGPASGAAGGSGGSTGTGTQIVRLSGGDGDTGCRSLSTPMVSGKGGGTYFGSGGAATDAASSVGGAGKSGTGAGGAGGGNYSAGGAGGGAGGGEYVEILITSPSSTYTYTVGASGAGGGTAGGGGSNGGAGGSGIIIVEEYYGS